MAGRICLLKSVLNSLPLYFISIFLMPQGVCKLLTSIQKRFLWFGASKHRNICKVQWQIVMRDKCKGGLGIGSLLAKNKAMLFKWVQRLGTPNTSLWKDYICKKYAPIFTNGLPTFSQRLTGVWRGIMSLLQPVDPSFDTIRSIIWHVVGNSLSICFCTDV